MKTSLPPLLIVHVYERRPKSNPNGGRIGLNQSQKQPKLKIPNFDQNRIEVGAKGQVKSARMPALARLKAKLAPF